MSNNREATTADMADLLIVQLNLWTAIEAIARELPPTSEAHKQVTHSRKGLTDALAAIVKRHDMDIQWSPHE